MPSRLFQSELYGREAAPDAVVEFARHAPVRFQCIHALARKRLQMTLGFIQPLFHLFPRGNVLANRCHKGNLAGFIQQRECRQEVGNYPSGPGFPQTFPVADFFAGAASLPQMGSQG